MKKLVLIAVVSFCLVFLLWPTTRESNAVCEDASPVKSNAVLRIQSADCKPAEAFGYPGGGLRYLSKVYSSGQFSQPEQGDTGQYLVSDNERVFFNPRNALTASFFVSLLVGGTMAVIPRARLSQ